MASALGRDYSSLYFDSYVPKVNLWVGYEKVLGLLGEKAYIVLQSGTLLCFALAFYIGTRGSPPNLRNAMFVLLIVILQGRIATSRPAVILSALFALLWVLDRRAWRVFLSFVFPPVYWLFFIYLIPLLLKEKLVVIPLIFGFVFWAFYGGGSYFYEVFHIVETSMQKNLPVAENMPIWNVFLSKSFFAFVPILLLFHYYGFKALSFDKKSVIGIFYFSLSNQIRYFVDNASFLLLTLVRFLKKDIPQVVVFALLPLLFVSTPKTQIISGNLSLLTNKRVLVADFSEINFMLAYKVKDIKLSPPMEIEWASKEVKALIREVKYEGRVDCELLKKTSAEVLVEKDIKGRPPECLKLIGLLGEYRLWQVIY